MYGEDTFLINRFQWRWRRLINLQRRARASLALRGWRGTLARIGQQFKHRPAVDSQLSLLPLDSGIEGLALPYPQQPLASVIIPVLGKLEYTVACLKSIALQGANAAFEVIVVDDASPDGSAERLASIPGLRVIRNATNLGFVLSCNKGADAARGSYLLFLNNDTQVCAGWLDALLDCFADHADCGIAGSQLIYPDGRLQEAGSLIFADGSGWNYGRFEDRHDPRFRYRRETDYVSGAALMIPRPLFQRIGGFDRRYAPAYYEDVDLAFAVRQAGFKVYYEPRSMVIHCEGVSSGTDLERGVKRHQTINQRRFASKWAEPLAKLPAPGSSLDQAILWQRRGRILIVDSMTPDPQRDSGSVRLCAIMHILREQGWQVCFFPDDGRASDRDVQTLGALGCELLYRPWIDGLFAWLRAHGHQLHAVVLCRHSVASQYVQAVRRHAPQARLIFDTVDLHFLREERAAEHGNNSSMGRQAQLSRQSELALIQQADVSLVVSSHEQALLHRLLPQARVALLSNIHALRNRVPPYAGRKDLVFVGGYGHPPNADAIHWLATAIVPTLRAAMPDLVVHVLGDIPGPIRRDLETAGLQLHGRVPDLAPWLDTCLASIAPLRFGAGVKGKINMAMSHGVPVIATSLAVEGMYLTDGYDVLLADEPAAFVEAIRRLMHDEALWQSLSAFGMENVRRYFSAEAAATTLQHLLIDGSLLPDDHAASISD